MDDKGDGSAGERDNRQRAAGDEHRAGPLISLVPLIYIDNVWPKIAEGMKRACERSGGDATPDWLFTICRKGDALLFVANEGETILAGMVCQVENWSGRRVLHIRAACGWAMDKWLPGLKEYREWLDRLGITAVVFEGRKGWQKVLPKARVIRQVYEVDLNG